MEAISWGLVDVSGSEIPSGPWPRIGPRKEKEKKRKGKEKRGKCVEVAQAYGLAELDSLVLIWTFLIQSKREKKYKEKEKEKENEKRKFGMRKRKTRMQRRKM